MDAERITDMQIRANEVVDRLLDRAPQPTVIGAHTHIQHDLPDFNQSMIDIDTIGTQALAVEKVGATAGVTCFDDAVRLMERVDRWAAGGNGERRW